jgi:hypothetical protein
MLVREVTEELAGVLAQAHLRAKVDEVRDVVAGLLVRMPRMAGTERWGRALLGRRRSRWAP